jgi:hypothetical protein
MLARPMSIDKCFSTKNAEAERKLREAYLCILGHGDVDEGLGGGVDDIQ